MSNARPRTSFVLAASIAISALLAPADASAFDNMTTAAGQPIRWDAESIALTVDSSVASLIDMAEALQGARMATDAWRGLPGVPDVHVQEDDGPSSASGGNRISVVTPWPHDPEHIAVTAHRLGWGGRIVGADILINGDVEFGLLDEQSTEPQPRHDLASVLTHEIGHVLGLGHSAVQSATMSAHTSLGATGARTLEEDDEAGVIDIYARPLPVDSAWACALSRDSAGGQRNRRGALGLLPMLLTLVLRRRHWHRRAA